MEEKSNKFALKEDFLAAYQEILFSKSGDDDVDTERRLLAVKYLSILQCESEEAASIVLSEGLKKYEKLMENAKTFTVDKEETKKWKSSLTIDKALSLIEPLPCQSKVTDKVCGRRPLVDRDIENIMKLFEKHQQQEQQEANKKSDPVQSNRLNSRVNAKPEQPSTSYQSSASNQPSTSYQRYNRFNPDPFGKRPRTVQRTEEDDSNREEEAPKSNPFKTARKELQIQQQQQRTGKKSLGGKASVNSKFICPIKRERDRDDEKIEDSPKEAEVVDERLKGIDEKLIELVRNEIMDCGTVVSWNDVAGLEHAKKIIKEIVVLPMLRPDIFTGLRRPPKGILLFGPPGTGKTLIGKCIASQSKSTFFSISASSLTSKWIGEGEKMVRALFAVARVHQPSVIFMDEIDSLLTQRSETEHESSRRIKTEFLVQLDGATTGEEDRILVIGATNRPQELDEAARRRFVKRLYVPLPEFEARRQIVANLLASEEHDLTEMDIDNVARQTEHYSGADMTNLCKEASMGPIRSIPYELLENIRKEDVRHVTAEDFREALTFVRPSVSQSDLGLYVSWDRTFGSGTSSKPMK